MKFLTAYHTDVGLRKKTNQDSMLIMQAETPAGPTLMASVCDGMGGLAKGEVASATMACALSDWFQNELPDLLAQDGDSEQICTSLNDLTLKTADKINNYGTENKVELGTTVALLLFIGNIYYIMNVGDSRVYAVTDQLYQLTKDQTFVQREIDEGRMTPEQAARDSRRSVLLQSVGAGDSVAPDFLYGTAEPNQVYLVCCDGFRHVITPTEFYQAMNADVATSEKAMRDSLVQLVETNKSRGEVDNISAILIRTC